MNHSRKKYLPSLKTTLKIISLRLSDNVNKYFENKIVERDNVIKELRTRIQHLGLKVELSERKIKDQEMLTDNNEQYAR